MDVRENVVWHDGSPFTPEDVIWTIQREGKPDGGNPVSFIWAGIDNFKVDGKRITADVKQYDPVIFKWMAFLTGYVPVSYTHLDVYKRQAFDDADHAVRVGFLDVVPFPAADAAGRIAADA